MALRLILEEVVRPLDSDAVTIMSFSVILSGCKAIAIVVSRWMDRDKRDAKRVGPGWNVFYAETSFRITDRVKLHGIIL